MSDDKKPEPHPPETVTEGLPDALALGLKQLFQKVADEPLPDEFLKLLAQLDETEGAKQDGGKDG